MNDTPTFDDIGANYGRSRGEDPRLAKMIVDALGDAEGVINVGAGTGFYEPRDRPVLAVEPSWTMICQRPRGAAPVVQGVAEALPLADRCAAASLAVLTLHHWRDHRVGLTELCRVARDRVVILTWDPASSGFWLVREYFPEFGARDRQRFPSIPSLSAPLEDVHVIDVPIPHDCLDGFLGAFWRRPEAYLDPTVRSAMSSFSMGADLSPLRDLADDLRSGAWSRDHEALLGADTLDVGYRLVSGRPRRPLPGS